MRRFPAPAVLTLLAAIAVPRLASAQVDAAMAETLFQEGKTLMAAGSFAQACPKLAESQRLDPGDGTLLALALCHEGEGKVAAAWSEYTAVANRSDARPDRVQRAKERLTEIEPRLARVSIVVPDAVAKSAPSLEIARDGNVLGHAAWGAASPVDPGMHVIMVSAQGKKPVRLEVNAPRGRTVEVVVPALEDDPGRAGGAGDPGSALAPGSSDGAPAGRAMRVTGVTLGAIGVVAVGIGTYFGLRAISLSDEARSGCDDAGCSPESLRTNEDARTAAHIANISVIGGLAAVGSGVLLYVLAPKASRGMVISPYAGPGSAGASLQTRF